MDQEPKRKPIHQLLGDLVIRTMQKAGGEVYTDEWRWVPVERLPADAQAVDMPIDVIPLS